MEKKDTPIEETKEEVVIEEELVEEVIEEVEEVVEEKPKRKRRTKAELEQKVEVEIEEVVEVVLPELRTIDNQTVVRITELDNGRVQVFTANGMGYTLPRKEYEDKVNYQPS